MGLFSRMFASREQTASRPARSVQRSANPKTTKPGTTKPSATKSSTAAKNPVFKHAGCSINHRTAQAASGCRNR